MLCTYSIDRRHCLRNASIEKLPSAPSDGVGVFSLSLLFNNTLAVSIAQTGVRCCQIYVQLRLVGYEHLFAIFVLLQNAVTEYVEACNLGQNYMAT